MRHHSSCGPSADAGVAHYGQRGVDIRPAAGARRFAHFRCGTVARFRASGHRVFIAPCPGPGLGSVPDRHPPNGRRARVSRPWCGRSVRPRSPVRPRVGAPVGASLGTPTAVAARNTFAAGSACLGVALARAVRNPRVGGRTVRYVASVEGRLCGATRFGPADFGAVPAHRGRIRGGHRRLRRHVVAAAASAGLHTLPAQASSRAVRTLRIPHTRSPLPGMRDRKAAHIRCTSARVKSRAMGIFSLYSPFVLSVPSVSNSLPPR